MNSNLPNFRFFLLSVDSKVRSIQGEATQVPRTATSEFQYIHSEIVSVVHTHALLALEYRLLYYL